MKIATISEKELIGPPTAIRNHESLGERGQVEGIETGVSILHKPVINDVTAAFGLMRSPKGLSIKAADAIVKVRCAKRKQAAQ
jgi:hypothetical protein